MGNKHISFITCLCFLFTSTFASAVEGGVDLAHAAQTAASFQTEFPVPAALDIPASLGHVTGAESFDSDTLVVNIQDLHCHPEVQRNIAKILALLDNKFKLSNVYVEGGYGDISTAWLNGIHDTAARNQITEDLINRGRLSGAEYYSMTTGRSDLLKGLEDEKLHKANIVRLGKILERQPVFEQKLRELSRELAIMKARHLSANNKRFDRMIARYRDGKIDARKYQELLVKYLEKINARPQDYNSLLSLNFNDYPAIKAHREAAGIQKHLNYGRVSKKLQNFVQAAKSKLPYGEYEQLLKETDNLSRPDLFCARLARLSEDHRFNIEGEYPELSRYLAYMLKVREINPVALLKEERRLTEDLRSAFSKDITELEIAFLADFFGTFEDYLTNKLSAEDYEYFTAKFAKFKMLWSKHAYQNHILDLAGDFPLLDEYYSVNAQRNAVFFQRLQNAVTADCPGTYQSIKNTRTREHENAFKDVVVVVTGGFHTKGLTQLLENKKISYATVTPSVTAGMQDCENVYQRLARLQSQAFSSQALSLTLPACNAKLLKADDNELVIQINGSNDTLVYNLVETRWVLTQQAPMTPEQATLYDEVTRAVNKAAAMAAQVVPDHIGFTVQLINELVLALGEWGTYTGLWGSNGLIWKIATDEKVKKALGDRIELVARLPEILQNAEYYTGRKEKDVAAAAQRYPALAPILEMEGLYEIWDAVMASAGDVAGKNIDEGRSHGAGSSVELLAALELDNPGHIAGMEFTGEEKFEGYTITKIRVPARDDLRKAPAGFEIVQNELGNCRDFELVYDDAGRLLFVFPSVSPDKRRGGLKYFDLSDYYFDIPSIDDPHANEKYQSFYTWKVHIVVWVKRYKAQKFGDAANNVHAVEYDDQESFAYVALDPVTGDWQAAQGRINDPNVARIRKLKGYRKLTVPVYPTVYSAGQDGHFDFDKEYYKALYRRSNIKAGDDVLVIGPGSGADSWVVSQKSQCKVYAIGINPLEVANTKNTARLAGFDIEAKVGDNLADKNGVPYFQGKKFRKIIWNMPYFIPEEDRYARNKFPSYADLWDGDYQGTVIERFFNALPDVLEEDGYAIIWNTTLPKEYLKAYKGVTVKKIDECTYKVTVRKGSNRKNRAEKTASASVSTESRDATVGDDKSSSLSPVRGAVTVNRLTDVLETGKFKNVDHVIFDVDGVILSLESAIKSGAYVYGEILYGRAPANDAEWEEGRTYMSDKLSLSGTDLIADMLRIAESRGIHSSKTPDEYVAKRREMRSKYNDQSTTEEMLVPGIVPFLEALKKDGRRKLSIVSSGGGDRTEFLLETLGLKKYFIKDNIHFTGSRQAKLNKIIELTNAGNGTTAQIDDVADIVQDLRASLGERIVLIGTPSSATDALKMNDTADIVVRPAATAIIVHLAAIWRGFKHLFQPGQKQQEPFLKLSGKIDGEQALQHLREFYNKYVATLNKEDHTVFVRQDMSALIVPLEEFLKDDYDPTGATGRLIALLKGNQGIVDTRNIQKFMEYYEELNGLNERTEVALRAVKHDKMLRYDLRQIIDIVRELMSDTDKDAVYRGIRENLRKVLDTVYKRIEKRRGNPEYVNKPLLTFTEASRVRRDLKIIYDKAVEGLPQYSAPDEETMSNVTDNLRYLKQSFVDFIEGDLEKDRVTVETVLTEFVKSMRGLISTTLQAKVAWDRGTVHFTTDEESEEVEIARLSEVEYGYPVHFHVSGLNTVVEGNHIYLYEALRLAITNSLHVVRENLEREYERVSKEKSAAGVKVRALKYIPTSELCDEARKLGIAIKPLEFSVDARETSGKLSIEISLKDNAGGVNDAAWMFSETYPGSNRLRATLLNFSRRNRDTGLGLCKMYWSVKLMGGTLSLCNIDEDGNELDPEDKAQQRKAGFKIKINLKSHSTSVDNGKDIMNKQGYGNNKFLDPAARERLFIQDNKELRPWGDHLQPYQVPDLTKAVITAVDNAAGERNHSELTVLNWVDRDFSKEESLALIQDGFKTVQMIPAKNLDELKQALSAEQQLRTEFSDCNVSFRDPHKYPSFDRDEYKEYKKERRDVFSDNSFDIVVCDPLLYLSYDILNAQKRDLCTMQRVLKPGGRLILKGSSYNEEGDVEWLLKKCGFKLVSSRQLAFEGWETKPWIYVAEKDTVTPVTDRGAASWARDFMAGYSKIVNGLGKAAAATIEHFAALLRGLKHRFQPAQKQQEPFLALPEEIDGEKALRYLREFYNQYVAMLNGENNMTFVRQDMSALIVPLEEFLKDDYDPTGATTRLIKLLKKNHGIIDTRTIRKFIKYYEELNGLNERTEIALRAVNHDAGLWYDLWRIIDSLRPLMTDEDAVFDTSENLRKLLDMVYKRIEKRRGNRDYVNVPLLSFTEASRVRRDLKIIYDKAMEGLPRLATLDDETRTRATTDLRYLKQSFVDFIEGDLEREKVPINVILTDFVRLMRPFPSQQAVVNWSRGTVRFKVDDEYEDHEIAQLSEAAFGYPLHFKVKESELDNQVEGNKIYLYEAVRLAITNSLHVVRENLERKYEQVSKEKIAAGVKVRALKHIKTRELCNEARKLGIVIQPLEFSVNVRKTSGKLSVEISLKDDAGGVNDAAWMFKETYPGSGRLRATLLNFSRRFKDTGLGLCKIYWSVKLMGGTLSLCNIDEDGNELDPEDKAARKVGFKIKINLKSRHSMADNAKEFIRNLWYGNRKLLDKTASERLLMNDRKELRPWGEYQPKPYQMAEMTKAVIREVRDSADAKKHSELNVLTWGADVSMRESLGLIRDRFKTVQLMQAQYMDELKQALNGAQRRRTRFVDSAISLGDRNKYASFDKYEHKEYKIERRDTLQDDSFDMVVFSPLLYVEYYDLPGMKTDLSTMQRVLKPGGRLIFKGSSYNEEGDVEWLLKECGFKLVSSRQMAFDDWETKPWIYVAEKVSEDKTDNSGAKDAVTASHIAVDWIIAGNAEQASQYTGAAMRGDTMECRAWVTNVRPQGWDKNRAGIVHLDNSETGQPIWGAIESGRLVIYSEADPRITAKALNEQLTPRGGINVNRQLEDCIKTLLQSASIDGAAGINLSAADVRGRGMYYVAGEPGTAAICEHDIDGATVMTLPADTGKEAGEAAFAAAHAVRRADRAATASSLLLYLDDASAASVETMLSLKSHQILVDGADKAKAVQDMLDRIQREHRSSLGIRVFALENIAAVGRCMDNGLAGCVVKEAESLELIDFACSPVQKIRAEIIPGTDADEIMAALRKSQVPCRIIRTSGLIEALRNDGDLLERNALAEVFGSKVLSFFGMQVYNERYVRDAVYGFDDAEYGLPATAAAYLDGMRARLRSGKADWTGEYNKLERVFHQAVKERTMAEEYLRRTRGDHRTMSASHKQMLGRVLALRETAEAGQRLESAAGQQPDEAAVNRAYHAVLARPNRAAIDDFIAMLELFEIQFIDAQQIVVPQSDIQSVAAILQAA